MQETRRSASDAKQHRAKEQSIETHSHELANRAIFHKAHSSSADKLLVPSRGQACNQCHNELWKTPCPRFTAKATR